MIPILDGISSPDAQALLQTGLPGGRKRRILVLGRLHAWARNGWLRTLDVALAGVLWREVPRAHPDLILAAAWVSHLAGRGHVCLDLAQTLADPLVMLSPHADEGGEARAPAHQELVDVFKDMTLGAWLEALICPELVGVGPGATPLVRVGHRLYLRRFWTYEQSLGRQVSARLAPIPQVEAEPARLRACLDILFPARPQSLQTSTGPDWQKLACALAARQGFSVITGGPGTGKTTTVLKLLVLLQFMAMGGAEPGLSPARPLRIGLAAPTGKAAARLGEAIANSLDRRLFEDMARDEGDASAEGDVGSHPVRAFLDDLIRTTIPRRAATLHRLLGGKPHSPGFRHNADTPLSLDVLVIDEASMVDLALLAAALEALPANCRVILLGDKDQLASVEAGAVLGGLCARARDGHYTPGVAHWLHAATGQELPEALIDPSGSPLDQAVAMLRTSHRFAAGSAIGRLAEAVNGGDGEAAIRLLEQPGADLGLFVPGHGADPGWHALVLEGRPGAGKGYGHYLTVMGQTQPGLDAGDEALDAWARAVLAAHGEFQLLCALRQGPWGVAGLNERVTGLLQAQGLIRPSATWYLGRPVMVLGNDYNLGLMNGDVGVTLARPSEGAWRLQVAFAKGSGTGAIQWVSPGRLTSVATVFAMTVHKSQGSEFDHVALVLPPLPGEGAGSQGLLTRELLYTGITRARRFLTLVGPSPVGMEGLIRTAVARRVVRTAGPLPGLDGSAVDLPQ